MGLLGRDARADPRALREATASESARPLRQTALRHTTTVPGVTEGRQHLCGPLGVVGLDAEQDRTTLRVLNVVIER